MVGPIFAIKRRQYTIISRLNGLKNENQIESRIRISLRGKGNYSIEIKDLTPKLFKNANKIFFKESCNFLE